MNNGGPRKDLKVQFQHEVRKFRNVDSYKTLVKSMSQSFELDILKCKFYYIDEDGDKITVKDDYDLEAAFESFESKIPKLILTQFISTTKNDCLSEDPLPISNFSDLKSVLSRSDCSEKGSRSPKAAEGRPIVECSSLSNSIFKDSQTLSIHDEILQEIADQQVKSDATHNNLYIKDTDKEWAKNIDITYETITDVNESPAYAHQLEMSIKNQFEKLDLE